MAHRPRRIRFLFDKTRPGGLKDRRCRSRQPSTEVQPAPPGLAAGAGARAVCRGPLRRDRRPGASQADAGAVPPGPRGEPAQRVRHRRLRPPRLDRRRPPRRVREDAGQGRRLRLRARSGPSSPAASSSPRARSTTPSRTAKLKEKLEELDRTHGTRGNRIYLPGRLARVLRHDHRATWARRA